MRTMNVIKVKMLSMLLVSILTLTVAGRCDVKLDVVLPSSVTDGEMHAESMCK